MSASKKTLEAEEHIRKAEKYLKTSFMKWTPDYDPAADEFSRAATCFKVGKEHDRTLDALNRACECYKEVKSLYQAAKMLEQSVIICRDAGKLDLIVDYASRGALLYRQNGNPESAAQLLEKAAKILEPKFPEKALDLYTKAAETIATANEDRPKEVAEYLTKVARLNAKAKNYDETINALRQTIHVQQDAGKTQTTGRLVGGLVLTQLAREDVVAANKAYSEFGGWCDTDLAGAIQEVLQAFEDEDADAAKAGLNKAAIKNLDIEFARMAVKDIPLPDTADLEAAASQFGAQRAEATKDVKKNVEEEPEMDPPKSVVEEQKQLEEEDDEDDLC